MMFERLFRIAFDERTLPWVAALLGGLLSAWIIFQANGVLNSDGLLYLEAARLFDAGDCCPSDLRVPWVLYPVLIALVHKVSGLGFQSSAHLLTILMFAVTSAGVVSVTREAGGDRRVMSAAALLLFVSPYMVGKVLPMVVRDHGFWAAHVWSVVFLLRFYRSSTWADALGWGVAAILALLFRSEGITYLLLLPLVLLMMYDTPWRSRLNALFRLNSILLVASGGVLLLLLGSPELSLKKLGGLGEPLRAFTHLLKQFSVGFEGKAEIFAQSVLGSYLTDYAMPGLLLTLAYALILKLVTSAGWIQLGLGGYALMSGMSQREPRHGRFFLWLGLLGFCNAGVLIFSFFLLPKRYLMSIATIIVIYAAFGLVAMLDGWRNRSAGTAKQNRIYPAVLTALMLQAALILWPENPKDSFEIQAARWLQSHITADSRVYFDTNRLRYYVTGDASGKKREKRWEEVQRDFSTTSMQQYDYMLVHVSRKMPEREKFLTRQVGMPPLVRFDNGRGSSVLIFQSRR